MNKAKVMSWSSLITQHGICCTEFVVQWLKGMRLILYLASSNWMTRISANPEKAAKEAVKQEKLKLWWRFKKPKTESRSL